MRLLRTDTLEFEEFFDKPVPKYYAILSHRWEDDEVTYQDLRNGVNRAVRARKGYGKVKQSCLRARDSHRCHYIWIDSCCINRSNSAELSESINSMFDWYKKSSACIAYLCDIDSSSTLESSVWFKRGWTLQELIAPSHITFYGKGWEELGTKKTLCPDIEAITGIPSAVLLHRTSKPSKCDRCNPIPQGRSRRQTKRGHQTKRGRRAKSRSSANRRTRGSGKLQTDESFPDSDRSVGFIRYSDGSPGFVPCSHQNLEEYSVMRELEKCSIAQRLSWASGRNTTKPEDMAYSLLGIFSVNMPLIYGEGRRAFVRLQEEIIKRSDDQSILAFARNAGWQDWPEWSFQGQEGLLAETPSHFAGLQRMRPSSTSHTVLMSPTSTAIETTVMLCPLLPEDSEMPNLVSRWLGILYCTDGSIGHMHPALVLEAVDESRSIFRRVQTRSLVEVSVGSRYVTLPTREGESADYVYESADAISTKISLLLQYKIPREVDLVDSQSDNMAFTMSFSNHYSLLFAFPDQPWSLSAVPKTIEKTSEGYELWGVLCVKAIDSETPLCVLWGMKREASSGSLEPWCQLLDWPSVLKIPLPPGCTADQYGQMFKLVVQDQVWHHPNNWKLLAGLRQGGACPPPETSYRGSRDNISIIEGPNAHCHQAEIKESHFLGEALVLHLTLNCAIST